MNLLQHPYHYSTIQNNMKGIGSVDNKLTCKNLANVTTFKMHSPHTYRMFHNTIFLINVSFIKKH